MKILDSIILLLLFGILGVGVYLLYLNLPTGSVQFEDYILDGLEDGILEDVSDNGIQFYLNMRYRDRRISYSISEGCSEKSRDSAVKSFSIIQERSILEFREDKVNAEIEILCSDIVPEPEEKGHFVAGEGGPSKIINTSRFAVIFSGKVSLFRENECEIPNVALHEILHALGFDHNSNKKSVMFPVTECNQEIDDYIINELNRLYSVDSVPDLVIEKVNASKNGPYLNFEVSIGNFGLADSKESRLNVYVRDKLLNSYDLDTIEIGIKKILTVNNLRISRSAEIVNFEIESIEEELSKENNEVEILLLRE
jgi:predicted Zn-dependent protease